jgi:hypothetical protein
MYYNYENIDVEYEYDNRPIDLTFPNFAKFIYLYGSMLCFSSGHVISQYGNSPQWFYSPLTLVFIIYILMIDVSVSLPLLAMNDQDKDRVKDKDKIWKDMEDVKDMELYKIIDTVESARDTSMKRYIMFLFSQTLCEMLFYKNNEGKIIVISDEDHQIICGINDFIFILFVLYGMLSSGIKIKYTSMLS